MEITICRFYKVFLNASQNHYYYFISHAISVFLILLSMGIRQTHTACSSFRSRLRDPPVPGEMRDLQIYIYRHKINYLVVLPSLYWCEKDVSKDPNLCPWGKSAWMPVQKISRPFFRCSKIHQGDHNIYILFFISVYTESH